MISITRERRIPALAPAALYALLADPQNLPRILPRIARVEAGEPAGDSTPLTAYFQFGDDLGQRAAPGVFRAVADKEVAFECAKPLPIVARWTLHPQGQGTLLKGLLQFDLKPLLGPLALMTPTTLVKQRVGAELEQALRQAEKLVSEAR
ncbi:MAG TPA: SRPBCC family protein [Herpetosiphonaceae bacterium]